MTNFYKILVQPARYFAYFGHVGVFPLCWNLGEFGVVIKSEIRDGVRHGVHLLWSKEAPKRKTEMGWCQLLIHHVPISHDLICLVTSQDHPLFFFLSLLNLGLNFPTFFFFFLFLLLATSYHPPFEPSIISSSSNEAISLNTS